MTRPARLFSLSAWTVALLVVLPIVGQEADRDATGGPQAILADMSWLAGTWSGEAWGGTFVAHYSTPDGGKILSHSKLLRDGQEAFYEFELFEERDGAVFLQPFPRGEKLDNGFTLTSMDPVARKAVFENPDKDYPTRAVYHRESDDRLVITLTDPHGGTEKVERFALSR